MQMGIKQKILEIHPARYSNGTLSKCWVYNLCDMLDPLSDSFKEVKEKKNMENSNITCGGAPLPDSISGYSGGDGFWEVKFDRNIKEKKED